MVTNRPESETNINLAKRNGQSDNNNNSYNNGWVFEEVIFWRSRLRVYRLNRLGAARAHDLVPKDDNVDIGHGDEAVA